MAVFKKLISSLFSNTSPRSTPATYHFEALEERVLLTASVNPNDQTGAIFDSAAPSGDDKYEDNDTMGTAKDLKLKANKAFVAADLTLADDDWFKFKTTGAGNSWNFVQIAFEHSQGNLDLQLYNSNNQLIKSSLSSGNFESIDMSGLAAGTYYIRVFNSGGNPTGQSYDLSINAPSKFDGEHTLYLNFDGANLSRQELEAWENGEWLGGTLNYFDSDQNGIQIGDFLANLADREKIIAQIIKYVQKDLAKFGIQVVRHFGDAVAGVEATTIFLGPSTLTGGYHIACDIDVGNVNQTDIAFVGNENWGNWKHTSLAMADVTLHEAGHTFGLFHVSSGHDNETMGLRYNQPDQDKWVRNTQFRNESYRGYPGHGLNGTQNSFQYMKSTFVTNSSSPHANPALDGGTAVTFDALAAVGGNTSSTDAFVTDVATELTDSFIHAWALKSSPQ